MYRFNWAWWYILVISALGRLRQGDLEFKASMDYLERPCLKKRGWGYILVVEHLPGITRPWVQFPMLKKHKLKKRL
jgi:hypothetical protein